MLREDAPSSDFAASSVLQRDLLTGPSIGGTLDENVTLEVPMFTHIVSDPAILGGKPCIRGSRISVEFILELFASGASHEDILRAYPHLSMEGIAQALRYAARFLKNESIVVAGITT
jgi:uncharacterized protein (DUF433 family)